MRFIATTLLMLLAGCGGSDLGPDQGENIVLGPEALQPKSTATSLGGVDFTKPVRAFGTEPFWALDIAPGKIRFEDFQIKDGEAVDLAPHAPMVSGNVAVIETRAPDGEAVTITLSGESCLEVGTESNILPLKASVKIGARTLTGCAGQKLPDPGSPEALNAAG